LPIVRPVRLASTIGALLAFVAALAVTAGTAEGLPAKPPPADAKQCALGSGGLRSRPFWFRAADGIVLAGAEYGRGARGVVLAPESGGSHCGWLPFIKRLTGAGYHVLAYDMRGRGESPALDPKKWPIRYEPDVVGAVHELRRLGVRTVVAGGASLGGASVLAAGPKLTQIAEGIIDFSGEPDLANAAAALPHITLPLLVVGSRTDPYADAQTSRRIMATVASKDKQLLLLPGGGHGWDLVQTDPNAAHARTVVLRWLAAHDRST
jgi:pimeloyl-ACP methyl ester carboxylesterase